MGIIGIPAIAKDMIQTHREYEDALKKAVREQQVGSGNIEDTMKEIKCINYMFSPWKTNPIDRKAAVIIWYKAPIRHRSAVED